MPIDYKKYPSNWKTEIRPVVLLRAKNCCEECGAVNKSVYIIQDKERVFLEISKEMSHFYLCPDGMKRMVGMTGNWTLKKIVLTIAHLDHDITNNDYSNLKALCQKCHLNHDKEHHRQNAKATIEKKKGLQSLF